MNAETVLTGVVTGILTGGITGYFTALYAMRQFKAQRAFDRQLAWYERTVRALGAVPHLHTGFTVARDDRTKAELLKALLDLQHCGSEAPLYADQSSYELLQRVRVDEPKGN